MEATCETCRFGVSDRVPILGDDGETISFHDWRFCNNPESTFHYSYVAHGDFCGEHQPRETEGETEC